MEIPTDFPPENFEPDFNSSQPFDCERNFPGYHNFQSDSFTSGGSAFESGLQENNLDAPAPAAGLFPGETSLSVLVSRILSLGLKAEQLREFYQRQSELQATATTEDHHHHQPADSAINSILREVIVTGAAIVSKSFADLQRPDDFQFTEGEEIVEMNEDDILAEHTHFCEICGKGFRRDANVRMHMRSHGDRYKTQEALMARGDRADSIMPVKRAMRSYSCPVEKCGRNRRHSKFRPLKTLSCLRNHYKRSHCPKMYSCNKCGKDFSVVSDLKFHGRNCGHTPWRCSCGTTFSRKDKLFGHVTLFEGHKPILPSSAVSKGPVASAKNCKISIKESATDNEAEDPLLGMEWNGVSETQTEVYEDKFHLRQENLISFSNEYLEEDLESNRWYESMFSPLSSGAISDAPRQT